MKEFNDRGNVERFVDRYAATVRYTDGWGWMVYRQGTWERCEVGPIEQVTETMDAIEEEIKEEMDEETQVAIRRWRHKCLSAGRIEAVMRLGRGSAALRADAESFDRDPLLLNCKNGIIDLKTGDLRIHSPEHYCTGATGCMYVADAKAPTWDKFMKETCCGDEELVRELQESVGYSLTGLTSERAIFILHGTGANGKSVFLDTINELMGGYAAVMPPEALMVRRGSATIPNDVAMMRGKRMVVTSESEEGSQLAIHMVKMMTGDHKLTARFLHHEFFTFVPKFKIWFATNHMPRLRSVDDAIRARIRRVPFQNVVPRAEQDTELLYKLKEELPGILNWAVEGCLMWQARGRRLSQAKISFEASQSYMESQDRLGRFLEECVVFDEAARTASRDLYTAYTRWCENEEKCRPLGHKAFSMAMQEQKSLEVVKTGGVKYWLYVELRPDSAASLNPQREWYA